MPLSKGIVNRTCTCPIVDSCHRAVGYLAQAPIGSISSSKISFSAKLALQTTHKLIIGRLVISTLERGTESIQGLGRCRAIHIADDPKDDKRDHHYPKDSTQDSPESTTIRSLCRGSGRCRRT